MTITLFELAQRFIGVKEFATGDNPQVMAFLKLDDAWPGNEEVPWCSAFVNYVCWLLRLPRSKSLAARSWLTVGQSVSLSEARVGFDIVVLKRGAEPQPGAEVVNAPGHVGIYAGVSSRDAGYIDVLGGNQADRVCVLPFKVSQVLSVRRLA